MNLLNCFLGHLKARNRNTKIYSYNIAKNVKIGKWCIIAKRTILNEMVEIGDFTYLNANKYWITVESNVKIGKFCSIAPGVHIGAGNHDYTFVTTHPILFDKYYENALGPKVKQKQNGLIDSNAQTIVGNDVWIGMGAIIKRGLKIGNGAVIAAGSVVVKDVPDYSIVGGNPAKVIKYRTEESNIEFFKNNEKNMWWNWSTEEIARHIDAFYTFEDYKKIIIKKNFE